MTTCISNDVKRGNSVAALNNLFAKLDCSLARYLSYARPWVRRPNMLLDAVARRLSHEHEIFASSVARLIYDRRGIVRSCVFPMGFTSYNDLSLEYLAPRLLEHERALNASAEECAEHLSHDPEARRVVNKIASSSRRYAALLEELVAPQRVAPPACEGGVDLRRDHAASSTALKKFDPFVADPQTAA